MRAIPNRAKTQESGVALLIAIVVLLVVSAAAISMVVASGTEGALNGNYRSGTTSYYAAMAGLEEGRGRLSLSDPNTFGAAVPNPVPLNTVCYVTNPLSGETVDPKTAGSTYADAEYAHEFAAAPAVKPYINSVWTGSPSVGPLYKWTRVNAVTERSLNIDVNQDGAYDNAVPLYYDGARFNLTTTGAQVLELTALAALSDGSQKLVQYTVAAPLPLIASFPSALTLDGPTPAYGTPHSNPYHIDGTDRSGPSGAGACASAAQPTLPAIGVVTASDGGTAGTVAGQLFRPGNYTGTGGSPSVVNVSSTGTNGLPNDMQTVSALEQLAQSFSNLPGIITLTDGGNGTGACTSAPASWGTAASPVIIYAHCALDMSSASPGYGTLVVTGALSASGNFGWRGVILDIGQGQLAMNGGGNGEFDGAILVAKTRNAGGSLLPSLGSPSITWSGGGGNGIYYDSCWINAALANTGNAGYPILSFREVAQ